MTDILDVAQNNNLPAGQSPPPAPPISDNFFVPPPEEIKPPEPPKEATPPKVDQPKKKRMKPWILITGILIILITLPLIFIAIKKPLNLFSKAAPDSEAEKGGYHAQIQANQINKNKPAATSTVVGITIPKGGYVFTGTTPPAGTYLAQTPDGKPSLRLIAAPGVFEGAVKSAMDGNQTMQNLLQDQYGVPKPASGQTNEGAYSALLSDLNNGYIWAPPGVGGVDTWHQTSCDSGGGLSGVGCGGGGGGGGNSPPGNNPPPSLPPVTPPPPSPPPQCTNIIAVKDGQVLTNGQLAALHPGDTITLEYAPGGSATKVRFRVNGGGWSVTTTKQSNGYFVWNYTLADNTSFSVEAQWFDGTNWN